MGYEPRVPCPACYAVLPPPEPGARLIRCPRCHHQLTSEEKLSQTAAHTPDAKRRSSRPPPR